VVQGRSSGFGMAARPKMCSGEGREVLRTALEYITTRARGRHVCSTAGMKPALNASLDAAGCRGCHTPEEIENPGFT
jgi:hypothetical protein